MTPDTENFEQLRRLLALKRHEQPPPGYFNKFPGEVIARIRAGEGRESAMEGILDETSWLQRLWTLLQGKPAVVGAFGAAICGLLVAGILQAERAVPDGAPTVAVSTPGFAAPMATPVSDSLAGVPMLIASNSAPVASSGGSLFDQVQLPSATPASSLDRFILPNQ